MTDFKQLNKSPIWMWAAGAVAVTALVAIVLGAILPQLVTRQASRLPRSAGWNQPATPAGWRMVQGGTGPWGQGPDRGNANNYLCLGWSSRVESWDTLFSAVFCPTDTCGSTLSVRTLLRFGRRGPGKARGARCEIIASVYGEDRWVVIRDYGRQDFNGIDEIPLPSSFRHANRIQFAWVSHVYDTADLRYWCLDEVCLRQQLYGHVDLAVAQALNPRPRDVIPPSPTCSTTVMVVNLGCSNESATVWVLLDSNEVGVRRLEIPFGGHIPVKFEVGGETDNADLLVEHRRDYSPYRSSADVRLGPGPHTLTFVVEARFDDRHGNDTLRIPFTVAGEFWQRLRGEYPAPRRTMQEGFAVAGDNRGSVYVRNPGESGIAGKSFMILFMTLKLPDGQWTGLAGFEPYLQATPSERPTLGGACVVKDSLFFCQLNDSGPLMKYDIVTDLWGVTSYPTIPARRLGTRTDLAGGICWDDADDLYVLGHTGFYRYSISLDTWSILSWRPGSGSTLGPGDTCGSAGDLAFLDGCLYTLTVDRSLICYDIRADAWCLPAGPPGKGRTHVCRLAADPDDRRIYVLTDCGSTGRSQFLAYSPDSDSWILDLPQPEWISQGYVLTPGSVIARAGRYLVAARARDSQFYVFNLPMLEDRRNFGPIRR